MHIIKIDEHLYKELSSSLEFDKMSLDEVVSLFLKGYEQGILKPTVVQKQVERFSCLKPSHELRKLSIDEWRTYVGSLSKKESELLWERDDAPYITDEVLESLNEQLRRIDSGEEPTYGPFASVDDLSKFLNKNDK